MTKEERLDKYKDIGQMASKIAALMEELYNDGYDFPSLVTIDRTPHDVYGKNCPVKAKAHIMVYTDNNLEPVVCMADEYKTTTSYYKKVNYNLCGDVVFFALSEPRENEKRKSR